MLMALAFAGCGKTVINGDDPPIPEYTSPATVLKAVQISFNQSNIDYLEKSLSPEFIFYFDPRDVGASPPGKPGYKIPASWSYDDFTKAANRMLHTAYSISLFVPVGSLREPGENETTYKAENVTISLLVMVDEVNGFKIDKGFCDFAFEAYYNERKEKRWRLTKWWDHTSGGYDEYTGGAPGSLGSVLALYYRE
ncbi:MAG: hypothetical protein V3W11_02400 [bacterium]